MPYIGDLYQKLYLSRIADNMHVMLSSGISAVRALEITAAVVENDIYEGILARGARGVKAGAPLSEASRHYPGDIPAIMVQMLQIGEETGEMGNILERMAKFYNREVNAAVDTLVSLIEPALIVRWPWAWASSGGGAPAYLQPSASWRPSCLCPSTVLVLRAAMQTV
jgi:type IV pilus assembly protein PilC